MFSAATYNAPLACMFCWRCLMPNIQEWMNSCGTPPSCNATSQSELLFQAVYALVDVVVDAIVGFFGVADALSCACPSSSVGSDAKRSVEAKLTERIVWF